MKKLCEHEGRGLPDNAKSDCWNDVDETEYACSVSSGKYLGINHNIVSDFTGEEENHAPP